MESIENLQCAELWNKIEPGLRKLCIAKLQSAPDEIDDIIAEAFLALCKKVSESGMPENPNAWMYSTVNHLIISKYRKQQQDKSKIVNINSFNGLPLDYDLAKEIEDRLLLERLKDVLEKELSEQEKLLLRLIYDDELKMKEIADILHTTETAVKQKHYRLSKNIRNIAKKILD